MKDNPTPSQVHSSIASRLQNGNVTVGVIGLGVVGEVIARLSSAAGVHTIGYDHDSERVNSLEKRTLDQPEFTVADHPALLGRADVLFVTVRLPVGASGNFDATPLERVSETLTTLPDRERLVILETTAPPGTTRNLASELLKSKQNRRTLVAYCPERLKAGSEDSEVLSTPRLVGGLTPEATDLTCRLLERLGLRGVPVSSPEIAELSKLLENASLTAGIGLMGEITRIAHALNINAKEVASAAATKPFGYQAFWPGAGVGGHCLPNDLRLLQITASTLNVDVPLLKSLNVTCNELTPTVVDRLEALMQKRGVSMAGSCVWVIGVGFKVGSSDTSATPAVDLIRILRQRQAKTLYSDAKVTSFHVDGSMVERIPPDSWPVGVSAAVILSGDPTIHLSKLLRRVKIVLDVGGAQVMPGSVTGIETL